MLEIKNVSKSFGKKSVLNNISMQLDEGIYGLLGPNGSGKTTLIRKITGLYPIKKGEITYNGTDATVCKEYYASIGYLPQNFGLFKELTVKEVLEMFAALKGIEKDAIEQDIERVLKIVNLSDETDKKCSDLSGGMVRRLGLAQAFMGNPKIIILDEPTVGLDPEERLRLKTSIAKFSKNKTVLISTHIVEDVETLCNKIIIMKSGKILMNDDTQEIANMAKDKVYILPEEELVNVKTGYHLEKNFLNDGLNYSRILSNTKLDYAQPKPTVEDAYIYAIHNLESSL